MDQVYHQYEMPIPSYAVGTRILLIDHDIASLMHTTSVLEEATYRVTSTTLPDIALSMMHERANQFDLVMAAVEMRGMDCITFLRRARILSNTPVVLMSYKEDVQLAIRAIQLGACQYYVKPIDRDNIRSLWQYVFRKKRNIIADSESEKVVADPNAKQVVLHSEKPLDPRNDPKQKGKEIMVDTEEAQEPRFTRRELTIIEGDGTGKKANELEIKNIKRSDDGNDEKEKEKIMSFLETDKRKTGKVEKKHIRWNAEPHAKFMKLLMMDSGEATQQAKQAARGTPNATKFPLAAGYQKPQNSIERLKSSDVNTTAATSAGDTSCGQREPATKQYQGAASSNSGNVLQTQGAGLGIQCNNLTTSAPINLPGQNNSPQVRRTGNGSLSSPDFANLVGDRPSFNPWPQQLDTSSLNLGGQISQTGITAKASSVRRASDLHNINDHLGVKEAANNSSGPEAGFSDLTGRIDQIRRAYRTSSISGKTITPKNTQASLRPQLQNQGADNSNHKGKEAGAAIMVERIDGMPLCGKRNRSQFENASIGDFGNATEQVVGKVNMLGDNMVQYYGQHRSYTSSKNSRFSSSQNVCLPNATVNAPSFKISESNPPSFVQNACDLQMEPTVFQDTVHPIVSTNNNSLLGSKEMPTGTDGPNWEHEDMRRMTSENSLPNQAEKLKNDFGEKILEGSININASDEFRNDADASNSQQTTYDDSYFDQILAELRNDFC